MTLNLESAVVYDLESGDDYQLENEGADRTTVGLLSFRAVQLATGRRKDLTPAGQLTVSAKQLAGTRTKTSNNAGLLTVVAHGRSAANTSTRTNVGMLRVTEHIQAMTGSIVDRPVVALLVVKIATLGTARKDSTRTGLLIARIRLGPSVAPGPRVDLGLTVGQLRSVTHFVVGPLVSAAAVSIADFDDGALVGGLESSPPVTVGGFSPVTSVGPIREDM